MDKINLIEQLDKVRTMLNELYDYAATIDQEAFSTFYFDLMLTHLGEASEDLRMARREIEQ